VTKAMIRIGLPATAGAEEAGRRASSARHAGPSLDLAFIDPCEQQWPRDSRHGTWLGVGLILRFGSRLERRVMDGSLHREACAGRHRHAQRGIGARSP